MGAHRQLALPRVPTHARRWSTLGVIFYSSVLLGCVASVSSSSSSAVVSLSGKTMGTRYSIKCWSNDPDAQAENLNAGVNEMLEEINRQMSTYIPDSELSRFNAAPAGDWFEVSPEIAFVTSEAIRFHDLTEGASDVTVGPLVELWKFGSGRQPRETPDENPTEEQVSVALQLTGCEHLEARLEPPALKKSIDQLQVDLSSIAKGYAVDAVTGYLEERGFPNFMVEIGGEVRAGGTRVDGKPWRIGVEKPDLDNPGLYAIVPLDNRSLATSGDYRNFRNVDNQRVSHIINPSTGRPLPFRGWSVTLLTPTCLEADALATALLVMGEDRGYDWCEKHGVAALFVMQEDGNVIERATSEFPKLTPLAEPVAQ